MIQITEIEKDIFKYIERGKYRKPATLLSDLLNRLEITQIDSFVDLLSRVLKTEKGPKIARAFNSLNRGIKNKSKLYEIELIFIKKHLLIDGEHLIDSFFGTLGSGFEIVKGRIFLTNYRIIASGFQKQKANPQSGGLATPKSVVSLVATLAKDVKVSKNYDKFLKAIRKSMNYGFYSVNRIQYGSYYPLSYPDKIDVSTQSLKFSTSFSYILDNKRVFGINEIQINRKRLSNETHEEFQANLAESYKLITKALKDSTYAKIVLMAQISDIGPPLGNFFKKNEGKAWTAKSILKRVDELNLTRKIKQEVTEKMIIETLDRLYNEGYINRNIHEDQFFYFL